MVCSGRMLALAELLHVGQVQRALGRGALALAAHHTVDIPEDPQALGDDWVGPEDAAAGEVGLEALEDDHIGRDDQEGARVVVQLLAHGVEVLPGDGKRHHLGLAGARRHLGAVAREAAVGGQAQVAARRGEALQQVGARARSSDLVDIDQRLDGPALRVVVGEARAVGQAVVGAEPVVEQQARRLDHAAVAVLASRADLLPQRGHARRGAQAAAHIEKRVHQCRRRGR